MVLWELLTCEIPYKDFDSSAIIWGVGNHSLHVSTKAAQKLINKNEFFQLPIPASCPEGYKLLIKQCWSEKPKNRPSFRIILAHLEIAGAELSNDESYCEQQKSWQKEIRETLQTSIQNGTRIHDHEQELIRKRQEEWKHAKDVRLIYERKLERTNNLYTELSACFVQLEEREREIAEREKQIGTSKPYRKAISQLRKQHFDKISRRRLHLTTTPATSSPSPPNSPLKTSLYVQLDGNQTKSVIQQPNVKYVKKSRHRRVGSGGSANVKSIISRDSINRRQYESENRNTSYAEVHTQTDVKDLEEKVEEKLVDNIPAKKPTESISQKNQDSGDSSNESDIDDNVPDTTSSSQNNNLAMVNSMATSIMTGKLNQHAFIINMQCLVREYLGSNLSYDNDEHDNEHRVTASDDDHLENLRRKVNELIIETTASIDSYSTNSSTNTIINRHSTIQHSKTCSFDVNKNIKSIKCSCDGVSVESSIDEDLVSDDEDFDAAKAKFSYSLRMKRWNNNKQMENIFNITFSLQRFPHARKETRSFPIRQQTRLN